MSVTISVLGEDFEVPSSAADTNWAAQQVEFEQALAGGLDTVNTDLETLDAAVSSITFVAITPLNGWSNDGGGAYTLASGKARDGMVLVRGVISGGSEATVCGTLASGSRPTATLRTTATLTGSDDICTVTISTAGSITIGSVITTNGGSVGDGVTLNVVFSVAANP